VWAKKTCFRGKKCKFWKLDIGWVSGQLLGFLGSVLTKNIVLTLWFRSILAHFFARTLLYTWLTNNLGFICISNTILMTFTPRGFGSKLKPIWTKSWCFNDNWSEWMLHYWSLHDFQHVCTFILTKSSMFWVSCCWVHFDVLDCFFFFVCLIGFINFLKIFLGV
jgi:hypothetical protein